MKTQRNDKCPCGSGKKYKNCCLQITLPKHVMMDPNGVFTPLSDDESPWIDDKKYRKIQSLLKTTPFVDGIKLRSKGQFQKSELEEICKVVFNTRVLQDGEFDKLPEEEISTGGHFCPLPNGKTYWNVGMFGSVWTDIEVSTGSYRIAFLENDCTYAIMEME
jgi:hypothetical protein